MSYPEKRALADNDNANDKGAVTVAVPAELEEIEFDLNSIKNASDIDDDDYDEDGGENVWLYKFGQVENKSISSFNSSVSV